MGEVQDRLSDESFKQRGLVVTYLVILIIVGTVGNSVVLLVYIFRIRPSVARVFIIAMAAFDLLTSVIGLPLQLATIRYAYNTYSEIFCRAMFAWATIPTQTSGLLLVVVAIERYRRVCGSAEDYVSIEQAATWILAVTFITVVVFTPFVPLYGVQEVTYKNTTVYMCWVDDHTPKAYADAYVAVVFIFFVGGLVSMGCAYSMITARLVEQRDVMRRHALMRFHRKSIGGRCTVRRGTAVAADTGSGSRETILTLCSRTSGWSCREHDQQGLLENSGSTLLLTVVSVMDTSYSESSLEEEEKKAREEQDNVVEEEESVSSEEDSEVEEADVSDIPPPLPKTRSGAIAPRYRTMAASIVALATHDLRPLHMRKKSSLMPRKSMHVASSIPTVKEGGVSKADDERTVVQKQEQVEVERKKTLRVRIGPEPVIVRGRSRVASEAAKATRTLSHQLPAGCHHLYNRTTKIMAVLTILYVVNWLPHLIVRFASTDPINWCEDFTQCSVNGGNIHALMLRSYYLNSAVNAFVYGALNAKFRQECVAIVNCHGISDCCADEFHMYP